jgi:hypothetical protein
VLGDDHAALGDDLGAEAGRERCAHDALNAISVGPPASRS